MCYLCHDQREGSSGFFHGAQEAGSDWSLHGSVEGSFSYDYAMNAAAMAAGASFWDKAVDWVEDKFDAAYDWVSQNISTAPLSLFSLLATTAPFSVAGVRFAVPPGLDPDVQSLLSGSQWSASVITYSLPDSRGDYQWFNPSATGYRALTFATEQAIRYTLEGYSPYAGGPRMGLTSVEGITNLSLDEAGRDGATLQIAGFTPGSTINRSHGYYPGVPLYGGDVWLTRDSGGVGTYSHALVLHELGHSLGLKHPHDSGGVLPRMSSAHDSNEYTVMSYRLTQDDPQTFMQYDVAALQALYGADFVTNGGDTRYSWSPTTGQTFVNGVGQGTPVSN